jgi:chlorobactene glucosyltransferase
MLILLIGAIFALMITLWIYVNLRAWPMLVPNVQFDEINANEPLVSILIPARNESRNIGRCIESLMNQEYKNMEIICLDDRSDDNTFEIVQKLATIDPRIKIIHGRELPAGWIGKPHACHQLSEVAIGDWLLFTDADTIHASDSVRRAIATAQARHADVLTGFPRIESTHTLGWLVLPLMHFLIALHLPTSRIEGSTKPMFMAAHGAFMLYQKRAYVAVGGHEAVQHRNALVEDMTMAKSAKSIGLCVTLVDITPTVACEMYEYPSQIWNGFAKNIYNGVGRSTLILFGIIVLYFTLYLLPVFLLIVFFISNQWLEALLAAWMVTFGIVHKAMVDQRFGVKKRWSLYFPLSIACMIAIALRSWLMGITGRGYEWKGRVYH